jgi:hypothetical protein
MTPRSSTTRPVLITFPLLDALRRRCSVTRVVTVRGRDTTHRKFDDRHLIFTAILASRMSPCDDGNSSDADRCRNDCVYAQPPFGAGAIIELSI